MAEETTPFSLIGGEAGVRAPVDDFYDRMDALPEAAEIRAMHPADLTESREKLFLFLTGWMGGPQLYIERHGHPRLRRRHMPFPVNEAARDQWMLCMDQALEATVADPALRSYLSASFYRVADFMRNR